MRKIIEINKGLKYRRVLFQVEKLYPIIENVNNKQKDSVKMLNLGHNLLWPALAPNITLCITVACLTKPRFWGM
ncbi:MAG: Uncharacterised protein [Methanobacteriota archaeon]|nr:MAG: Uncharacterised protein [Euryarchaeota archaeon]